MNTDKELTALEQYEPLIKKRFQQIGSELLDDLYRAIYWPGDIDAVEFEKAPDEDEAIEQIHWPTVAYYAAMIAETAAAISNEALLIDQENDPPPLWSVTNRAGDRLVIQAKTPAEASQVARQYIGDDLAHIGHASQYEATV